MTQTNNAARRELIVLGVAAAASAAAIWKIIRSNKHFLNGPCSNDPTVIDNFYLERAHELRLSLKPPLQSNFRVVALFLLEDGKVVFGTNDEPSPNISLAMCAERCALLEYRVMKHTESVKSIYIVTDASSPVSPGTACREYMNGHPAIQRDTRIVMQSKDKSSHPLVMTLAKLHPFPSIYNKLDPEEQSNLGASIQQCVQMELEHLDVPELSRQQVLQLVKVAHQACGMDDQDSLHVIRYGAAMAIQTDSSNGTIEIIQASQIKALEFSSTLDAVCQLASRVLSLTSNEPGKKDAPRVLALIQVDQFGIPHGPFAQARAFLVEHGLGDCRVILTSIEGDLTTGKSKTPLVRCVVARQLAPFLPEFR